MSSLRAWGAAAAWTVPTVVLASGLLPPHVHPALLGALALSALLLCLALAGAGRLPSPGPAVRSLLLAGSFVALLSAGMALHPMRSMRMLIAWFACGVVFAASWSRGSGGEARRIVRSIALLGALLGALGLYQSLVAFPAASAAAQADRNPGGAEPSASPPGPEESRLRSGRAVGTLGLPALLASVLILGIPLAAVEAAAATGARRLVWAGATVIQVAGLAASRSVGGAAALAAATALCAAAWREIRPAVRRAVVGAILIAATLGVLPRLLGAGEGSASQALDQRLANWKAALSMAVTHPLLGVGPGNYGVAFPLHRAAGSNETQHAHNAFIEIIADLGWPVVPLLALALTGFLGAVRRASAAEAFGDRDRSRERWRIRALGLGCLAWAIHATVDFTPYVAATAIPFFAAAGLLARDARSPGEYARAGLPTRALLLALALLAAVVALPDSLSRTHLERAVDAARLRDLDRACAEAEAAVLLNPLEPETHATLAQALLERAWRPPDARARGSSDLGRALLEAEEAVRLDPHTANRRAILARARAGAGDAAGAYAAMAAAARLNPFRSSYFEERDGLSRILTGAAGDAGAAGVGP